MPERECESGIYPVCPGHNFQHETLPMLSNLPWACVAPLLPGKSGAPGRSALRRVGRALLLPLVVASLVLSGRAAFGFCCRWSFEQREEKHA